MKECERGWGGGGEGIEWLLMEGRHIYFFELNFYLLNWLTFKNFSLGSLTCSLYYIPWASVFILLMKKSFCFALCY